MRDGDSGTSAALTLSGARRERLPDACDGHKHAADGYASAVAPADGSGMFCSSGTAATVGKLARCAAGAAGAATAAAAGTGALSLTTAGAGALHTAAIGTTPRESQSVCHSFTSEAALMTGSTDGLPSCQQLQQHQGNPPRCAAGSSCSSASLPTRTSACGRGVKRSRSSSSAPSALMGFTLLLTAALQGAVLMSGVPCAAAWGWPFSGSSSSSTSGGGGSRGSSSRSSSAAAARSAGSGSLSSLSSAKNSGRRTAALTASSDRVRSTRSSSSGTTVGGVKPQREAVSGGGAVWREPDPVLQAAGLREAPYNSAARDVAALLASDPTDTDTDPGSKDAATALSLDASRPADYRLPLNDAQSLLRQMLEEEEARRALPYNLTKPYKLPAASYEDEHFVFATGSYPDRYLLAQATRSWRRGVRAFIAINNTQDVDTLNERNQAHHERYEYFPDEGEGDLGPRFHGFMRGDSRAAMAPFMAHEHYGETYKWLLYGDDDTIFYMPAVKRMLAHLDPELPYAISDNLWYRSRHPNLFAPRCLPCHMAVDADPPPGDEQEEEEEEEDGGGRKAEPITIPSVTDVSNGYGRFLVGARTDADMNHGKAKRAMRTRAFQDWNKTQHQLAEHGPEASVPGLRYVPRPACPFCTREAACTPSPPPAARTGCYPAGGHGGAGMIFSVGLLRRLSAARMKECFMQQFGAPGGDSLLSTCLWREGYAFTDPGTSTLAMYDGNYVLFSSEAGKWALHDPLTVLIRGKCDSRCKWLIRNAASHHGRGRHFQGFGQSAAYLYAAVASQRAALKWQAFMAQRDLDLKELAASMRGESAEREDEEEQEESGGERSKGDKEGSTSRRKMHSAGAKARRDGGAAVDGGGGSASGKSIGSGHQQQHSKSQHQKHQQHEGLAKGWFGGRKASGGGAAAASRKAVNKRAAASNNEALLASSKTAQAAEALQRGLKAAADVAAGERRVAAQHAAAAERALGVHGGLGSASRSLQGEKSSWEREGESEVGLDYVPHRRGYFDSSDLK
ncbi:hypothetical protein CHLRE_16g677350v5 [Chlamydomonas reinhardtii]|uniref:Uncharacterized protein n=1 Tax=Chlamydomonas reinhardtii TaxID=3055 RepID=A0A2K3CVB4_CHLRE|nr:uncharacterized protein CHLRE_16g677350v5 [Chlamydomonas reinhardtii]PNW72215.1 hypothetical protein CHLRE_16g677350v5 [Chlamydomonas reinhardtii]